MGRMQVLGLGLVLVLSWAVWATSTPVDPRKTVGPWYHIFTASNELDEIQDYNHMWLYSPFFDCICLYCDAISLEFEYRYMGYCSQYYKVLEKQHEGLYQTMVPPEKVLEVLDVGDSMLLLGSEYRSSSSNTTAVLVLGRASTLSEDDMENLFLNVLWRKGIMSEPVHFTGDDICRHNRVSKE